MKKFQAKVSSEVLKHFNCGLCRKWWTIGDVPKKRSHWYCPWCGKVQNFNNTQKKKSKL